MFKLILVRKVNNFRSSEQIMSRMSSIIVVQNTIVDFSTFNSHDFMIYHTILEETIITSMPWERSINQSYLILRTKTSSHGCWPTGIIPSWAWETISNDLLNEERMSSAYCHRNQVRIIEMDESWDCYCFAEISSGSSKIGITNLFRTSKPPLFCVELRIFIIPPRFTILLSIFMVLK